MLNKYSFLWVILITLIVAGCHKVFGGGWFYGIDGEKITFAFNAQCQENEEGFQTPNVAFYTGQFHYNDKVNGVSFHGDIDFSTFFGTNEPISCKEETEKLYPENLNEARFSGECISLPGKVPGTFFVTVIDNSTPGNFGAGDYISVRTNCTPDGLEYSNEGTLGGGNIISVGHKG